MGKDLKDTTQTEATLEESCREMYQRLEELKERVSALEKRIKATEDFLIRKLNYLST